MSDTGDRLRELAGIVDHVEHERGAMVRDIDVEFKQRTKSFFGVPIGSISERYPVFDLRIEPKVSTETDDDPEREDPDELEKISGVGPNKVEILHDAGYETVEDVKHASQQDLSSLDGIGNALAARIKADVGEAADDAELEGVEIELSDGKEDDTDEGE